MPTKYVPQRVFTFFRLCRKTTPDEVVDFVKLDEELCKLVNREPHPQWFLADWYESIGIDIVCGVSLSEIRRMAEGNAEHPDATEGDHIFLQIAKYLEENFVTPPLDSE